MLYPSYFIIITYGKVSLNIFHAVITQNVFILPHHLFRNTIDICGLCLHLGKPALLSSFLCHKEKARIKSITSCCSRLALRYFLYCRPFSGLPEAPLFLYCKTDRLIPLQSCLYIRCIVADLLSSTSK